MMSALLFLILSSPAATASDDYRAHVDQAELFVRKGWWSDALAELETAIQSSDGRLDAEAWLLLVTVRLELCDADGARYAAERAHSTATSDDQAERASRLSEALSTRFGVVNIDGYHAGLTARLSVELTTPLFDGELKRYVRGLESCYAEPVDLPVELSLPSAGYRINGLDHTVEPGSNTTLRLKADELEQSLIKQTFALTHASVGVGVAAWVGAAARHMLPGPLVRLSLSQPAGPVLITLAADWTGTPYATEDGSLAFAPLGWGASVQLGGRIPGVEPLVMRLSAGYRVGSNGGIETPCENIAVGDSAPEWVCDNEGPTELVSYLYGLTHEPHAEVAVEYLGRDWTRGVGFGVSFATGYAFGFLGAEPTATDPGGEPVTLFITPEARPWQAVSVRFVTHLTLAF